MAMGIICYSQRLLNPFRGACNIIKYKSAEAVTIDGCHWDIYIRNDDLLKDLQGQSIVQTSDIRYGKWSKQRGLKRGPIYPSEDFRRLEQLGDVVFEELLKVHHQLPFPFMDHYELWLLGQDGEPLALLNSAVEALEMEADQILDWRAGNACRRDFCSTAYTEYRRGTALPENPGEYLTGYINSCTTAPASAQWFLRESNGAGTGLGGFNLPEAFSGRELPATLFPELFISRQGHNPFQQQLLSEFMQWLAPWFLVLQTIDPAMRKSFEQAARKQALLVEQQYRMYPAFIDEALIKSARVEAMMRKTQAKPVDKEAVMSTFYIELNPSPTE